MTVGLFRFLVGSITLFGLALQFVLMTKYPSARNLLITTLNFLSYFTILTNILMALCMLVPLIGSNTGIGRFFLRPSVRTAVLGYSAVVAIVYFVYLRNIGHDRGLERLADNILHYVTPALFTIDWLAFVAKGRVNLTAVGKFLIFPGLYAAWTLIYGGVTGWYPYPFFNVRRAGYADISANFVVLCGMLLAISILLVAIDRALAMFRRQRDR